MILGSIHPKQQRKLASSKQSQKPKLNKVICKPNSIYILRLFNIIIMNFFIFGQPSFNPKLQRAEVVP